MQSTTLSRILISSALLVGITTAQATDILKSTAPALMVPTLQSALPATDFGFNFRVGYGSTGTFINSANQEVSISGPEIGVDVPFMNYRGLELMVSGSVLLGGRLSSGGDTDGEVYRFLLSAKKSFGSNGAYGLVGLGMGVLNPRGGTAQGESAFIGRIAAGFPIKKLLGSGQNSFELGYVFARTGKVSGLFFGISGSL